MDDLEAGRYWEENAEAWTLLARQGWDVYRDLLNTPAFLELLPEVAGLRGLDLGCGEGHNTRLLAGRGALMWGIDIAPSFIRHALEEARGIRYLVASAARLPFPDAAFDFATAFMSLMDMPRPEDALREACRVLKPGGFLQFSIEHPCFMTPHRRLLRDPTGKPYAVELADYFDGVPGRVDEFLFRAAPAAVKAGLKKFRVPKFHRPLADWLNAVVEAGFRLERVAEPRADAAAAAKHPAIADTRIAGYFLHVRCRKAW